MFLIEKLVVRGYNRNKLNNYCRRRGMKKLCTLHENAIIYCIQKENLEIHGKLGEQSNNNKVGSNGDSTRRRGFSLSADNFQSTQTHSLSETTKHHSSIKIFRNVIEKTYGSLLSASLLSSAAEATGSTVLHSLVTALMRVKVMTVLLSLDSSNLTNTPLMASTGIPRIKAVSTFHSISE